MTRQNVEAKRAEAKAAQPLTDAAAQLAEWWKRLKEESAPKSHRVRRREIYLGHR